jgi:chromosomal replication initiation ATPase DnaA
MPTSVFTARQLSLDLPDAPPRYDRSSYMHSDSNNAAWRAGETWLASEEPALVVCGPPGAGKSHFAHALLENEKFKSVPAEQFDAGTGNEDFLIIDDMPSADPREFISAMEGAIADGCRLLLAGAGHPSEWSLGLKDLKTRLEAATRAVLADPDEMLIRGVIAKGFRDRQLSVSPAVVEYAAPRLPRTFAAAHGFVALADRLALEEKRKITTPFVQNILANLSEGDPGA